MRALGEAEFIFLLGVLYGTSRRIRTPVSCGAVLERRKVNRRCTLRGFVVLRLIYKRLFRRSLHTPFIARPMRWEWVTGQ